MPFAIDNAFQFLANKEDKYRKIHKLIIKCIAIFKNNTKLMYFLILVNLKLICLTSTLRSKTCLEVQH